MAKRAAAASNAEDKAKSGDEARHDSWRAILRDHAMAVWREGAGGAGVAAPEGAGLAALGPLAGDALELVETFTLGALARARRDPAARKARRARRMCGWLRSILDRNATVGRPRDRGSRIDAHRPRLRFLAAVIVVREIEGEEPSQSQPARSSCRLRMGVAVLERLRNCYFGFCEPAP